MVTIIVLFACAFFLPGRFHVTDKAQLLLSNSEKAIVNKKYQNT